MKSSGTKRQFFTEQERAILEEAFKQNSNPDEEKRLELAKKLNKPEKSIKTWFRNRKTKENTMQLKNSLQKSHRSHVVKYVSENQIPSYFTFYDDEKMVEPLRLLTNFSAISKETQEMVSLEEIDISKGIFLQGTVVLPPKEYLQKSTRKSTNKQAITESLNVQLGRTIEWCHDYTDDLKGIWIKTEHAFYKLLEPSKKYEPIFLPFKKRSMIWIELFNILNDENNDQKTWNEVITELEKKTPYKESDLVENSPFLLSQIKIIDASYKSNFMNSPFAIKLQAITSVEKVEFDDESNDEEIIDLNISAEELEKKEGEEKPIKLCNRCDNGLELVCCFNLPICNYMICKKCVEKLGWNWRECKKPNWKCPRCTGKQIFK